MDPPYAGKEIQLGDLFALASNRHDNLAKLFVGLEVSMRIRDFVERKRLGNLRSQGARLWPIDNTSQTNHSWLRCSRRSGGRREAGGHQEL